MKKLILSSAVMFLSVAMYAQATDEHAGHAHAAAKPVEAAKVVTPAPETLVANKDLHDFGKIPQGKPVTYSFEVKNTGKAPLLISNVQASCGCTTPEWDREKPIAPGATALIKVGYNAQAEGPFTKPVTITYNDGLTKVLNIKGEVWKTPAESAPANSALTEIKN
jgi:hypothetical protein